jgi:hypothetical protein
LQNLISSMARNDAQPLADECIFAHFGLAEAGHSTRAWCRLAAAGASRTALDGCQRDRT